MRITNSGVVHSKKTIAETKNLIREKQTHNLKILPNYYRDVISGNKTFEVRKNDRDFVVGDFLKLEECATELGVYTGRFMIVEIIYILDNKDYCKKDFVIIGFKK